MLRDRGIFFDATVDFTASARLNLRHAVVARHTGVRKDRLLSVMPPPCAHRVRKLEARLLAGDRWTDSGLVFTNTIGGPMELSNVLRTFKRHLAAADLPSQRFHDLRHCAASRLLAKGCRPAW